MHVLDILNGTSCGMSGRYMPKVREQDDLAQVKQFLYHQKADLFYYKPITELQFCLLK